MAEPETASGEHAQTKAKLLTLTDVSKRASISMPTLQRYKKTYQDRIPSIGEGRLQRYPEEAVGVFRQLLEENLARRGRPRKVAAPSGKAVAATKARKAGRKKGARRPKTQRAKKRASAAAAPAAAPRELLTLTEISHRTGISYPTLSRYVKAHLDRLPHEGSGRGRRYWPEAVAVFEDLRKQSRGGRPRKAEAAKVARKKKAAPAPKRRAVVEAVALPASLEKSLANVERILARLDKRVSAMEKELKKPLKFAARR